VQYLALGQSLDPDTELRALQILELCRPDPKAPILPNLRELRWCDFQEISYRYMGLFVHPGLVSFNALIMGNTQLIAETVAYISSAAPGLHSLKITPGAPEPEDSRIVDAIVRLLSSSSNLAELSVRAPVCASTLPILAQHPRLESISVRMPSALDSSSCSSAADSPTFRCLRQLTAHCKTVEDVIPLLNMVHSPCFTSLVLHLKIQPSALSLESLFTALCKHRAFRHLSVLIAPPVTNGSRRPSAPQIQTLPQHILTPHSIRCLLGLSKITHLILPQIPCDLDDHVLCEIASAWPSLERLTLGTAARLEKPRVSFDAICGLALSCPRLNDLGIAFDSATSSLRNSGNKRPQQPSHGGVCSEGNSASGGEALSRLHVFDIGCSSVADVQKFARSVAEVFPYVRICDPHGASSRMATVKLLQTEVVRQRSLQAA
jgi:hypothetical protein